jgi:hypothetical protein
MRRSQKPGSSSEVIIQDWWGFLKFKTYGEFPVILDRVSKAEDASHLTNLEAVELLNKFSKAFDFPKIIAAPEKKG